MKFIKIFKNSIFLLDSEQNIRALKILDVIKLQNLILEIFNNNVQQHMMITRETQSLYYHLFNIIRNEIYI